MEKENICYMNILIAKTFLTFILGTNTDYVIPRTEIEKTEEALNQIEREMSLKTYINIFIIIYLSIV